MTEKILIVDFGSQYTQLIARRVREINVYSEIVNPSNLVEIDDNVKGIILSGSPFSVDDDIAPKIDVTSLYGKLPVLGICYGAQYIAKDSGGKVSASEKREYGRAVLEKVSEKDILFQGISSNTQVWMSHADTIINLPEGFEVLASTSSVEIAAYKKNGMAHPVYGLQFHPEVTHTVDGMNLLRNFVVEICSCEQSWNAESFIESTVAQLKEQLQDDHVVLGLSGGVDSTVAAALLNRAVGKKLHCIFIDNGLLRKDEYKAVLGSYNEMGLNIAGVDAQKAFLDALKGVSDPEKKRKIIGSKFIDVFDEQAQKINSSLEGSSSIQWLAQGTIYPDVIESTSVHGPSATIKSHHNVGGLPEKMHLKVVEPLRSLFKDEVRLIGAALAIDGNILRRHPFPGPGLAVRLIGEVTSDKIQLLQEADAIFINALKNKSLYDDIWQAAVILLPIQSVGVMGDQRTYEYVVSLRAVTSRDGMTADWYDFPHDFLAEVSNDIINNIQGINRVVYDISSKPPATIEWE